MGKTIEQVKEAVAQLPTEQLKKFRVWYENFDSEIWDEQIEKDMMSGKLIEQK